MLSKSLSLIQYVSDLHLERGYKRFIIPQRPYLVLAGDIGYPSQDSYKNFLFDMSIMFDKVFIVSGNHEFDLLQNPYNLFPIEEQIENICQMRNNLFYLQKQQHIIDKNIVIAGCTLFSKNPKSKYDYHIDHSKWLLNTVNSNKTNQYIIATHHCPNVSIIKPTLTSNYFISNQEQIYKNNNVFMWIFGHTHQNINIFHENTFFTTNQYGYCNYPIKNYTFL